MLNKRLQASPQDTPRVAPSLEIIKIRFLSIFKYSKNQILSNRIIDQKKRVSMCGESPCVCIVVLYMTWTIYIWLHNDNDIIFTYNNNGEKRPYQRFLGSQAL